MRGYAPFLGEVRLAGSSPRGRRPFLAKSRPRLAAGSVQAVTDATFNQVLSAPFAVVDFWSPSCPYCMKYKPIFEEVASQYGDRVLMATGNVNDAGKSAGSFNINSIPATIFLANGKEVSRFEGETSKEDLVAGINRLLGGAQAPIPGAVPARTLPMAMVPAPASSGLSTSTIVIGGLSLAVIGGAIYLIATA